MCSLPYETLVEYRFVSDSGYQKMVRLQNSHLSMRIRSHFHSPENF
jgi:hypothetical protein